MASVRTLLVILTLPEGSDLEPLPEGVKDTEDLAQQIEDGLRHYLWIDPDGMWPVAEGAAFTIYQVHPGDTIPID